MLSKLAQKLRDLTTIADAYDNWLNDYQHPREQWEPRLLLSKEEVKERARKILPQVIEQRRLLEGDVGLLFRQMLDTLKDDCTPVAITKLISEGIKLEEFTNE